MQLYTITLYQTIDVSDNKHGGKMNVMNDQIRRPEHISPKSSPRGSIGSISPAYPRPDSSGTLKTTISLGKVPSVIHTGPFYLMKDMPVTVGETWVTFLFSMILVVAYVDLLHVD